VVVQLNGVNVVSVVLKGDALLISLILSENELQLMFRGMNVGKEGG
jgi:hypothetical protein